MLKFNNQLFNVFDIKKRFCKTKNIKSKFKLKLKNETEFNFNPIFLSKFNYID